MKLIHFFLLLLVVVVWGVNFVFVKIALDAVPPLFLCFTRFFFLSLFGIPFFKPSTLPFKWVVLYGLVMFTLQFSLMFSGMNAGVSAGLASLLLQIQVFFSILFAATILKERLNYWQLFGGLVSFSGIAIVFMNSGSGATLPGLVLVLAAAATWGGGSVIVKKMGKTQTGALLSWSSLVAWPPLLLLSLVFEDSLPLLLNFHRLSLQTHAATFFITMASTAFGFGVWNWLLQIYPLGKIAPFTLLVPIFGMMSSVVLLGESLEAWKILSALLVISGLCFILLGPRLFSRQQAIAPTLMPDANQEKMD